MQFIASLVVSTGSAGVGLPGQDSVAAPSNVVRIVGLIGPENKDQILADLGRPGVRRVIITSGGGEIVSNMEIARKIREIGASLEIEHYCMSSCVNYLTPAAREVHIAPGAVLGFHGSGQTFPAPIRWLLAGAVRTEKQFVRDIGMPDDIYTTLVAERDAYRRNHNTDGMTFWMVDRSYFSRNNIPLTSDSYFPSNQEELNSDVTRILQHSTAAGKELVMYGNF